MLDLLTAFPAAVMAHWPAFAAAAYLGIGFWIALREALESRRWLKAAREAAPLWPGLVVVTPLWPLLLAQKLVFWLILAWDVMRMGRSDRREREMRDV